MQIGSGARIAGFICDGTVIGDRSTVMGELVHEYTQPHRGWWEVDEPAPVIEDHVVVGYGAKVVGRALIGPFSYVAAGAIVPKDVPEGYVVTGFNRRSSLSSWRGTKLRSLVTDWSRGMGHVHTKPRI